MLYIFNKGLQKEIGIITKKFEAEVIDRKSQAVFYEKLVTTNETKYKSVLKRKDDTINSLKLHNIELKKTEIKITPNQLQNWGKRIKKRDLFCQCCGDKDAPLQAHHLYAKSSHPTLALENSNGIGICEVCHTTYHTKFKCVEDCNPYNFNEFVQDFRNKTELNTIKNGSILDKIKILFLSN